LESNCILVNWQYSGYSQCMKLSGSLAQPAQPLLIKQECIKVSNEENRNISEIDFQEINTAGPQLARDNAKYYEQMERVSERVGVRKSARGVSQDGVRLES
jgi:hypothetical protein